MVAHPISPPALTIVPAPGPLVELPAPPLTPPPDLFMDELREEPETKTKMPPLPTDIELGGSAFPDFLGHNHRVDTLYTAQPHWVSDQKGEPFTFRLNPNLSRMVSLIVESNATPYRTKSDFFRDAAYYLAVAVRDLVNLEDQRLDSLLQEAELRSHSDYEATLQEEVLGFEHTLTDAIIGNLERGALAEACRNLSAFWNKVQKIPISHRRVAHERAMRDSLLFQIVLQIGKQRGFDVPNI